MLNHLSTLTLRVLPHQAAFQPLCPKPVALCGAVVTQVQNWHFSWLNFIQLDSLERSNLCRPLCRAFLPSKTSALPPHLMLYAKTH